MNDGYKQTALLVASSYCVWVRRPRTRLYAGGVREKEVTVGCGDDEDWCRALVVTKKRGTYGC